MSYEDDNSDSEGQQLGLGKPDSESDSSDSDGAVHGAMKGGKFKDTFKKGYNALDKLGVLKPASKFIEKQILKTVKKKFGDQAASLVEQGIKTGAAATRKYATGKGFQGGAIGHSGGALGFQHARGYGMKGTGSREEVFQGLAQRTTGGLKKKDLAQGTHGRIVSLVRQQNAMKRFGGHTRGATKLNGGRYKRY
jgi:hypothetical protein